MSLPRRAPSPLTRTVDLARCPPLPRLPLFCSLSLLLVLVWFAWLLWTYRTSGYWGGRHVFWSIQQDLQPATTTTRPPIPVHVRRVHLTVTWSRRHHGVIKKREDHDKFVNLSYSCKITLSTVHRYGQRFRPSRLDGLKVLHRRGSAH